MNADERGWAASPQSAPVFQRLQDEKLKPQIPQMTQMGADPSCAGPPKAASGFAGGHGVRQGRALRKGATLAHPMEPTLAKRHPQTSHGPVFNLCESVESVDLTLFLRHL